MVVYPVRPWWRPGAAARLARMQKLSLDALAREHLERAAAGSHGRSAT